MAGPQITHEQIYSRLGRMEGLIEAEGEARKEFRGAFQHRLEGIEDKVMDVTLEVKKLQHTAEEPAPQGIAHALIRMFERQPFLGLIAAGVILGLGSGGVVAVWKAFLG